MSGLYDKDTGAAYGTYKTYIRGFIYTCRKERSRRVHGL